MNKLTVLIILISLTFSSYGQRVIISEVMYNSPLSENITAAYHHRGEFIELYNVTGYTVDLTGWKIVDRDTQFNLPSGTSIGPDGFLVLTYGKPDDPANYRLKNIVSGLDESKLIYYSGKGKPILNNEGDWITLRNNSGQVEHQIAYGGRGFSSNNIWNITASEGKSIQLSHYAAIEDPSIIGQEHYIVGTPTPHRINLSIETGNYSYPDLPNPSDYSSMYELDKNFTSIQTPEEQILDYRNLQTDVEQLQTVSYYDGLGRSTVVITPEVGQNSEDLISFTKINPLTGRVEESYLSYYRDPSTYHGEYIDADFAEKEQATFYETAPNIANDSKAFARKMYDARGRVKAVIAPGAERHLNSIKKEYTYESFEPDIHGDIIHWKIDNELPSKDGIYSKNELYLTTVTSEEGIKIRTVKDSRGLTITTQQYDSDNSKWIGSYNVYDDFGRVRFIVPQILSEIEISSSDQVDELAFQYKFDRKGRLVRERSPGSGWVSYVYDQWDRLVFDRHVEQIKNEKKYWNFYKYDALNRVIMSGEIQLDETYSELQRLVDETTGLDRFEKTRNNKYGYTYSLSFPNLLETHYSNYEIQNVSYFDSYDFLNAAEWDNSNNYNFTQVGFPNFEKEDNLTDLATGSKTLILGSDDNWLHSASYYDKEGRPIQSVAQNHKGGIDRTSSSLEWDGQLNQVLINHSTSLNSVNIRKEYEYTEDDQLFRVWQTISEPGVVSERILLAEYHYNMLGELIEKNLHTTDGTSFLQSIDYSYNLTGALTAINDAGLSASDNDLFGMEFYFEDDISINSSIKEGRYDGLPNAIVWNATNETSAISPIGGPKGDKKIAIAYNYNGKNQLQSTSYASGSVSSSAFNDELDHYKMSATYDDHGNIISLNRNAEGEEIDKLDYKYHPESNKLKSLDDLSSVSDKSKGMNDPMRSEGAVTEFKYDDMGNTIEDDNKKIQKISYNKFRLVEEIEFIDRTRIINKYDASGNKLSKTIVDSYNNEVAWVDYIGSIEYLNGEINQVFTSEGRAYKQNDQYHYEYFITDHQGNNRLAFGDLAKREVFVATMEEGRRSYEESYFSFPSDERSSTANHTPLGEVSFALSGGSGKVVGPSKVLRISEGDRVDIEVWAKHIVNRWTQNSIPDISDAVLTAFGTSSSGTGAEGASGGLSQALSSPGGVLFSSEDVVDDEPNAYVQFIFFNEAYEFVAEGSGFEKVGHDSEGSFAKVSVEQLTYNEPGHLFIYVANESDQIDSVFFDDLKITHSASERSFRISQINDYYPFGLPTSNSWRANGYIDPGLLYQSSYADYDSLTGYYDFLSRSYDPTTGRFFAVDPAGQFSSPYVGMGNVPHFGVDPDGEIFGITSAFFSKLIVGAIGNAGTSAASYAMQAAVTENWDSDEFLKSFGRGAVSGAISAGLSEAALGIASELAKNGEQVSDGLINVAFQAFSTSTTSVISNIVNDGWEDAFSTVNIGITDFTFTLSDGDFTLSPLDIANNVSTLFTYGRGFLDVRKGNSTVELDKTALSPRFKETKASNLGYAFIDEKEKLKGAYDPSRYRGTTTKMLRRAGAGGLNQNGASFLKYNSSDKTAFHESLHAIHDRIAGKYLPFIDFKIFGSSGIDHDDRYYEKILLPYINKVYPD